MDVVKVCPRLLHRGFGTYEGYITVKKQDFYVKITLPEEGNLKSARLQCEWRLEHLLRGYKQLLHQRLRQSRTLADFLVEFKSVLENQLTDAENTVSLPAPEYYKRLLQQIEVLGWERVVYVDSEFRELHLHLTDEGARQHALKVFLHAQHPDVGPQCKSHLPTQFHYVWKPNESGLSSLYEQFGAVVTQYQVLWDELGNIDTKTWVLEPENPAFSVTYRRIALGNNGSVQIDVDPAHPRMLPECRFLGADHVIGPLKQKLNSNIHLWDPDCSLLSNLETVLEISFPSPENTKKEDISVACGICYAYRLDAQIPDQVCEDTRCAQPFHQTCLYEWLRALASCRQSFNTVFGECPYCGKAITVKMPTK